MSEKKIVSNSYEEKFGVKPPVNKPPRTSSDNKTPDKTLPKPSKK